MWIAFAFGSAIFSGLTAILAKIGIKNTNSNYVTALRTIVVTIAAWAMVAIVRSFGGIAQLSAKTWLFLILSGLATGASWLCYYRALQLGDVNKVAPVDRSSLVLTVLFAMAFLGETGQLLYKILGLVLIGVGTALMVGRPWRRAQAEATGPAPAGTATSGARRGHSWLIFAIGSAVFAALTTILGKVGIAGVESNLGTAIRTTVVLVMAWLVVGVSKAATSLKAAPKRDLAFIALSGLATAAAWLCYYRALQIGPASGVAPIDKLSILFTVGFSWWVLHEKLSRIALVGLILLTIGTLVMLL